MYYAGYLTKTLPRIDDSTTPENHTRMATTYGGNGTKITVAIPNKEIRSLFHKWLLMGINKRMALEQLGPSVRLFRSMIYGPMDVFAQDFAKLVYYGMPRKSVGIVEDFYQLYVHAYLASAADAITITPEWEVDMEVPAGAGRCDIIVQRREEKHGALIELQRIKHDVGDGDGCGEKARDKLTASTKEAMEQLCSRNYRAKIRGHVTQLFEYGLSFLGPYCAFEAHRLERKPGEEWVVVGSYTAREDEERRAQLYGVRSS